MNKGYSSSQKTDEQQYQTLQRMPAGKSASDMVPKALYSISPIDFIADDGSENSITLAGHTAQVTDVIRMTSGALDGIEVSVKEIKGDILVFTHKFDVAVAPADTFKIMRHITLTISKDGELSTSSGPVQFVKDAAVVQVTKDTVTPTNTMGMPVEIVGTNGAEINITAGDIGVQLSHTGANPDSTRVGDGTTELGITLSNEAKVSDADALAEALLLKTAVAKEAKQDAANILLGNLDGKDYATQTTLAAVLAKIIAAPATEVKQDAIIAELQTLVTQDVREVFESTYIASAALDTVTYLALSAAIPAGTTVKEIELLYKDGSTVELFDGNGGASLGMVTQAGGKIPVNVVGDNAKIIHARILGASVAVDDLTINLIK